MAKSNANDPAKYAYRSKLTGETLFLNDQQKKGAEKSGTIVNLEFVGNVDNLAENANSPAKVTAQK